MAKCFVSFLGTSSYVPCRYGIDGRWYGPVQFVQTATLHLKCADWDAGDRVVIGCTRLAREKNLAALISELHRSRWPVEPEEVDLPDGVSEEELWVIFQKLLEHIGDRDELVFDITHSFRSLPLLFTVLIQYLRVVRNVRLGGVYYGAFERLGPPDKVKLMALSERNAPVIDLTPFLFLYDWSAAIDHFLRFGATDELERLIGGHVKPILKRTAGADADARTLRRLVEHLGEFTRHTRYARGRELAGFDFQSGIVAPLRRVRSGFLPALEPIIGRLAEAFADYPDSDPQNVIRSVGWCIEHGLIQQGITLLQEGLVELWVVRLADLLDVPSAGMGPTKQSRWQRDFVSALLAVVGQNKPATEWKGDLQKHRALAEACAQRLPQGFAAAYDRLTKLRNDINHGGFVEATKWKSLDKGLRDSYEALRECPAHADTHRAPEDRPRIYLLNTPVVTSYGEFRFSGPVEPEEARRRIAGGFVSAIGHQAAGDFLAALLKVPVPISRMAIAMQPGDAALVLRLRDRLPEGKVLSAEEMADVPFELGWLERTA